MLTTDSCCNPKPQIRGILLLWRSELLHIKGMPDQADRTIEEATLLFQEEQNTSHSLCHLQRFQLALSRQVRYESKSLMNPDAPSRISMQLH